MNLFGISIVEEQIRKHNIHNKDLEMNIDILSERGIYGLQVLHI